MTTVTSSEVKATTVFGRRKTVNKRVSPVGYFLLAIFAFLSVFPFYWMYVVASNTTAEVSKTPPSLIPGPRFMIVMKHVLEIVPMGQALLNTVVVGVVVAFSQVMFSALAGFAFAKLNFKARKGMILFVIGTMMLPSQLGIIPLFDIITKFGFFDSLKALIIPALVTAFGVFWMRQIIDAQVPNELLEAASIDGGSVLRIFWSVVLPIIRQSSFVLGLFSFLGVWNDFLWPGLVLRSPHNFTAQVAVQQLKASYFIDYALNMGGALMITAPLLILFVFVGRRLVTGVMDGAVKG